jgi:hypothetical protein
MFTIQVLGDQDAMSAAIAQSRLSTPLQIRVCRRHAA